MADNFNVVFSGRILDGFNAGDVHKNFAKVFHIELGQVERYFSGNSITLKKNTDHKTAYKFKSVMAAFGAAAELQRVVSRPIVSLGELTLESIEDCEKVKPHSINEEKVSIKFSCPKCSLPQDQGMECISCGIVFEKYFFKNNNEALSTKRENTNQSKNQVDYSGLVSELGENINNKAFVAALLAAVLGAFIWKFVALIFELEFSFVAWGIGGAVGFSAAFLGAKGKKAGLICGLMVFAAIISGKHMIYEEVINQAVSSIITTDDRYGLEEDALLGEVDTYYNDVDDISSKKLFIYNNSYTDSETVEGVSRSDLEDFDEFILPKFESISEKRAAVSDIGRDLISEYFDNMSIFEFIITNLGLLDMLFIFLGVTTAYRLADNGYKIFRQ